jgi:hypothetical protein
VTLDVWLSYSAGSGAGTSSSAAAGNVNTNGPALPSQVGGGSGVSLSKNGASHEWHEVKALVFGLKGLASTRRVVWS